MEAQYGLGAPIGSAAAAPAPAPASVDSKPLPPAPPASEPAQQPSAVVPTPVIADPQLQQHSAHQAAAHPPAAVVQPVHAAVPPVHNGLTTHDDAATAPITDDPHPSTASHPADPTARAQAPTATMDPNKPSSESAPTALPTNPTTNPKEQKEAIKNEHPEVVKREVEKTKAAEREIKGEKPKGTIVMGLEDDRLYAMLRMFDRNITHVLHPAAHLPKNEPDLRKSTLPNLPSHSEVLKVNLERVIAAVGPSSVRGFRELTRLMDWSPQERQRTASYCIAYFVCWAFGYALAGVMSFLVAIICFPDCRRYFFPPVPPPPFTPPSATDPTNKHGDESLLGHVDKPTVHRSKAEQAEEQAFEAASILQAYTTRLLFNGRKAGKMAGNAAVGEKSRSDDDDSDDDDVDFNSSGVKRTKVHGDAAGAQGVDSADVVIGGEKIEIDENLDEKKRKKLAAKEAKRKRDEMVGKMTKGTEDGLGALADTIERFTNALSPPSCYPDTFSRFKIAGAFIVAPLFLLTFMPAAVFARSATFFFGVGMWGQPVFKFAARKFVEYVPNWKDYLELLDLRNSILSGVPTDAQLTLHLLRVGEALGTPLPRPPPPPLAGTPKEAIKESTPADVNEEDEAEVAEAEEQGGAKEAAVKAKTKTKSAFLNIFRSTGKKAAGIGGDVAVDGAKKKIGSKIDRLLFRGNVEDTGGNSFPARLDGTSGHIIVEGSHDELPTPQVTFVPLSGTTASFVKPIDDIVEIKKSHVAMARLGLAWVSGADVEGLGLTIRFKSIEQQMREANGEKLKTDGETLHFTRVGRREELFVRLISMGRQRWESL